MNFGKNPPFKKFKFYKDLTEDSFCGLDLGDSFIVFNSIDNILYLIYSNENKSIISYNIIDNKKINEIKNAHTKKIFNFRNILDTKNKRDLIISISYDQNIKLWDINNFQCILDLTNINKNGWIYSACFLYNNYNIFIITSNSNYFEYNIEPIKIYDLNGNKISEINDSNYNTYFINTYYDTKLNKIFIITGNAGYSSSYDLNMNKIYHQYIDNGNDSENACTHDSIIINLDNEGIVKLIESSIDGQIRIWNFHIGILLNKIRISDSALYGLCLLNEEYLYIGCEEKVIKILKLSDGTIMDNNLIGHKRDVITIKKIMHPEFKECILSQGLHHDQIKLWINTD